MWTRCGPSCVRQHLQKSKLNPTVSCACSVKTAMQQIGKQWTRFPMAGLVKGLNKCEPQRWSSHSLRRLATSAIEKQVHSFLIINRCNIPLTLCNMYAQHNVSGAPPVCSRGRPSWAII